MGSSLTVRAKQHAIQTIGGNLGLNCDVQWFGRGGLCFEDVASRVQGLLRRLPAPGVLVVHAGGNDIGRIKSVALVRLIKETFLWLREIMPLTKLFFSSILGRRSWRNAMFPAKIDRARRNVNRKIERFMDVIKHDISHRNVDLYLNDGVHLSALGNAWFIRTLAQGIENCL